MAMAPTAMRAALLHARAMLTSASAAVDARNAVELDTRHGTTRYSTARQYRTVQDSTGTVDHRTDADLRTLAQMDAERGRH